MQIIATNKDGSKLISSEFNQDLLDDFAKSAGGYENITINKKIIVKFKQKAFNNAIQTHLDKKAQEFRYDNIMSARSYAGYENPFQAEAQKLAVWASNCWVKAGEIEADVESGKRDMPTIDEVLSELPVYE